MKKIKIDELIDDSKIVEITEMRLARIEKYKQLLVKTKGLQQQTDDKELGFIYSSAESMIKRRLVNEMEDFERG